MEGLILAADGGVGIDLYVLGWSAISFAIFAAILARVLWRPVIDLLDERRREIETNLSEAASSRAEAEEARAEYARRLADAQREAQDIVEKAVRAADEQRDQLLRKAQQEAEELLERARNTISQERDQAILQLRQEVAEITIAATERLLRRTMDDADHQRLAQEVLAEVGVGAND